MIEVFEGRLGSGKSYSAVLRMLQHIAKGGTVFTNIVMYWPAVVAWCRKYRRVVPQESQLRMLTEEMVAEFHKHLLGGTKELPVLAVIDEVQLWFNSRDTIKNDKAQRPLMTFLTQSRKVMIDVILITQDAKNADGQFMRLTQFYWRFKDLRRIKVPVFGFAYPFPHILAIQLDTDAKFVLNKALVKITSDVYDCYQTTALLRAIDFESSDSVSRLDLERAERNPSRLERMAARLWREMTPKRLAIVAIVLAVLVWKIWDVSRL